MKLDKLFIALTVASLATMLVSASASAGSLAFDAAGNLFETDSVSIFKFTPDAAKSTFATGLKKSLDLTFDIKGDLFVSDAGSHSILKFTPEGKKSTFASGLNPYEMAFDGAGSLLVSDYDSHSIFKFTPEGKKSTFATGLEPSGMAFGQAGNLFVSDADSHSIFKFAPDGAQSTFATGIFTSQTGGFLVFDRSGNLFVVDGSIHSIFKFAPDGTRSTFATGIFNPKGLVFGGSGNLVVSIDPNVGSPAIYKFTPDGTQSTLATGLNLYDMAFDRSDNLFVASGSAIFKFAPDGTKSTFASAGVSADKKWEYEPDESEPKIVKAGANEMALDLSDQPGGNGFRSATVIWAPDSKRFAFNYGQGRSHSTSLYQLRGDEWKALKSPEDEISQRADDIVAEQLKRNGLSEKKLSKKNLYLRLIWSTVKVDRWIDSNTAVFYASLRQVTARRDEPGEMSDGFGADLLLTLKFDEAGNWKIVKTHRMSEKEVKEHQ